MGTSFGDHTRRQSEDLRIYANIYGVQISYSIPRSQYGRARLRIRKYGRSTAKAPEFIGRVPKVAARSTEQCQLETTAGVATARKQGSPEGSAHGFAIWDEELRNAGI